MNAYIHLNLPEKERHYLTQQATEVQLLFATDYPAAEQQQHFLASDIAFGNVAPDWLRQASQLRWLQLESVGFGEYQHLSLPAGLTITNLRGMFSVPVAETALAGVLSLFRGLDALSRYKDQKQWQKNALRPTLRTLHGAQAIIVGGGSIGEVIRTRLQSFGAITQVMDKYSEPADITSPEALDKQLPHADIVIVCLPETEETIHFFDAARLDKLSATAVLVNVGRGSVLDETALIGRLQAGTLSGCVLDVTQEEPLPSDSPFWDCPHTIITQHTGGGSGEELLNKVKVFLTNLNRFQQDQPLENIVNLTRGY